MVKNEKTKRVMLSLLVAFFAVNFLAVAIKPPCSAESSYSTGLIAELGEASTVLIYSQIDATVKVYVPDENWLPTTDYLLVPRARWAWIKC